MVSATITGVRINVFWPACDWSEPFRETPQWKTGIFSAYSGAEQRAQLRTSPRYQAAFRIVTLDEQQTAALEAQLHYRQPLVWGVPWWPEKSYLLSGAASGAQSLNLDTTYRPAMEPGGLVLLWLNPMTWEAGLIESMTAGQINLAAPLQQAWPAGTTVVPMRKGHLGETSLGRPTNWVSAATFTFSCEGVL